MINRSRFTISGQQTLTQVFRDQQSSGNSTNDTNSNNNDTDSNNNHTNSNNNDTNNNNNHTNSNNNHTNSNNNHTNNNNNDTNSNSSNQCKQPSVQVNFYCRDCDTINSRTPTAKSTSTQTQVQHVCIYKSRSVILGRSYKTGICAL